MIFYRTLMLFLYKCKLSIIFFIYNSYIRRNVVSTLSG